MPSTLFTLKSNLTYCFIICRDDEKNKNLQLNLILTFIAHFNAYNACFFYIKYIRRKDKYNINL